MPVIQRLHVFNRSQWLIDTGPHEFLRDLHVIFIAHTVNFNGHSRFTPLLSTLGFRGRSGFLNSGSEYLFDGLVVKFTAIAIISTPHLAGDSSHAILIGVDHLNFDWIGFAVLKLKIQCAPVYSCILARRCPIMHPIHVIGSADNFQICLECSREDGRRYLTDTSTNIVGGTGIGVHCSDGEAISLGTFTDRVIEGEDFARLKNIAVLKAAISIDALSRVFYM